MPGYLYPTQRLFTLLYKQGQGLIARYTFPNTLSARALAALSRGPLGHSHTGPLAACSAPASMAPSVVSLSVAVRNRPAAPPDGHPAVFRTSVLRPPGHPRAGLACTRPHAVVGHPNQQHRPPHAGRPSAAIGHPTPPATWTEQTRRHQRPLPSPPAGSSSFTPSLRCLRRPPRHQRSA